MKSTACMARLDHHNDRWTHWMHVGSVLIGLISPIQVQRTNCSVVPSLFVFCTFIRPGDDSFRHFIKYRRHLVIYLFTYSNCHSLYGGNSTLLSTINYSIIYFYTLFHSFVYWFDHPTRKRANRTFEIIAFIPLHMIESRKIFVKCRNYFFLGAWIG